MRAGWYNDPEGIRRWWDGDSGWTQNVLEEAGTVTIDPGPTPMVPPPNGEPLATEPGPLADGLTPIVFLPCEQWMEPDDRDASITTFDIEGSVALPVYSSVVALADGCGEAQPWVATPVNCIAEVQRQCRAEMVLWDTELPESLQRDRNNTKDDQR